MLDRSAGWILMKICGKKQKSLSSHLLDVDTTGKQVRGDEHARRARAELPHDNVTLSLAHVSVHARDGEVSLLHLLREPIYAPPGVAVDDGLRDGEGLVQVAQGFQLPLLALHPDVKLLDT